MSATIVTALGIAGWAAALWMVVAWWTTRWSPPRALPEHRRLGLATGRVCGSVAGVLVAAFLVLGLGCRLLMRVLAATSPDAVQGRLTDAEEVVGEVTLGGTVSLVLFVTIFGGFAGLAIYALLRRWLPRSSIAAGLCVGAIGAGLLARPSDLLEPDNPDFAILRPTWLAIVLITGVLVTFAMLAGVLIDRWAARWPEPGASLKGFASLAPLAPLIIAPPFLLVALLAIPWTAWRSGQAPTTAGWPMTAGRVAVSTAAVAGVLWIGAASVEILGTS